MQALYNYESIQIAENNLSASSQEEARAKARFKAGSIAIKDYADTQSQMATNKYNLISAKND